MSKRKTVVAKITGVMNRLRRHLIIGGLSSFALCFWGVPAFASEEKVSIQRDDLEKYIDDLVASIVQDAKDNNAPIDDNDIEALREDFLNAAETSLRVRHVALRPDC